MDLAELLASLPDDLDSLDDAALATLRDDLRAAARGARAAGLTSEVGALIRAATEQFKSISAQQAQRIEAAAQIEADADAALAEFGDDTSEPAVDGLAAGDETGSEALAASARYPNPRRAVSVPSRHAPRANRRGPVSLVASGSVQGVSASGSEFGSLPDAVDAIYAQAERLRGTAETGEFPVFSVVYRDAIGGEMLTSDRSGPAEVSRTLDETIRAHIDRTRERTAMVASGGVPGPSEPRYSQLTLGQSDRPLRDGLPTVLAARGSLIYNPSPILSDVLQDTAAGAIGEITNAQDVSGTTKNVQEISAPTATTVTVAAETLRWAQGNAADRFNPERSAAFFSLGQTQYARHNDALRLADIKAGSTLYTDTPAKFGAYRDLKRAFLGITEEIEDRARDFAVPLRVLFPEYVPAMLTADMVAQAPGDGSWQWNEERMRADIESWDPNVNITWMKDSIRGRMLTTPSGQSPRTPGFDSDVEWCIFPEGAWVFLDGGQLDLGIVRDSVVSATNKFQTFFEGWEAVARMIPLSWWVTSSLCANGNSQAASAVNVCSPQSS